ncbi:Protein SSUH2 -like protein [Trichinella papuae]|uniref:Protein SSUH2-like protein n=2 Tax=Trichinella TaxID=6333 RepID=A0A0V0XS22_TRIPS|nr:Protein SSUH2 -like protein [Trichinella pseudospiralis]KRX90777.1 Protein SSUH2 -like protein [Trichinella pseudospiralis]KRZ80358.1 Protein SSUH2 -like protein [Trichinella papuae]
MPINAKAKVSMARMRERENRFSISHYLHNASIPPSLAHELQFPSFTEEEIRQSLDSEVKKHKYWSSSTLNGLKILKIDGSVTMRYRIESFLETRSKQPTCEPGTDEFEALELHCNNIWEVPCSPTRMFTEETKVLNMPGSSRIAKCASCHGQGVNLCFHCRNSGSIRCNACNGTGMKSGVPHPAVVTHPLVATFPYYDGSRSYSNASTASASKSRKRFGLGTPAHLSTLTGIPPPGLTIVDLCGVCQGRGLRPCNLCKGFGSKPCTVCNGTGKVRFVTKVRVKYSVLKDEYCHEVHLPDEELQKVTGDLVLVECQPVVLPIKKFPIPAISEQSERLIKAHLQKQTPSTKILKQRQTLEAVPIAEVLYEVGNRTNKFWVLGRERVAYVPQYPKKCSIL